MVHVDDSSPRWSEVTNDLMNSWMETGNQMWKGWFSLLETTQSRQAEAEAAGKPEFQFLTQRLIDNQALMMRLLKLSFSAWQDIFPKVEAGETWQDTLNIYFKQLRSQLDEFSLGNIQITQDMSELWQLYLKETQKFSQLWVTALNSSWGPMSQTGTGAHTPWIELNNLYWNLIYEETFGSLMQSPLLGPTRELTSQQLKAFDAWTDLYRASTNYQVILTNIQVRAFEELMQALITQAEAGNTVKDWRAFQQLWSETADRVFEEAFREEENLKIYGTFINSLNRFRLHQQALTEEWMKAVNLPSRQEVDEVHKNIYTLRKTVKALQKQAAPTEPAIQTLQTEVETLKATLASYADLAKALKQEVEALKQQQAALTDQAAVPPAESKPAARRGSQRRSAAKPKDKP